MMEKLAQQLHLTDKFEKVLKEYKEALHKWQVERETLRERLFESLPDLAGAVAEELPVAGPLLREGARAAVSHLLKEHQTSQVQQDAELLETPIDDLTRAFVTDLNRLADTNVTKSSARQKRERRVVLFFDTFEQLATEATPWLLNHFLAAQVSSNIVLVVAGRDPIERTSPDDPKRWLPYCDNGTIYWISLSSFTEDETRMYLIKKEITDEEQIATIWHVSQGLPLYLGLLATNSHGDIDPTKDVVDNFLRWIPEREQIKRQLALDAALFSKPFNQDDLEVFSYVSEADRASLYQWLIEQPFVRGRSQDGRYLYHDVARDLFCRHLYQRSQKGYYAIRQRLVAYYQELLQTILAERGEAEGYHSEEGLELLLAVITQLFLLPDRRGHFKAIDHVLHAVNGNTTDEQEKKIAQVLRELLKAYSSVQTSPHAIEVAKLLSRYLEADAEGRWSAVTALLDKALHISCSTDVLAYLYLQRSWAYFHLYRKGHEEAIADCEHTIQLNPKLAQAYTARGWCYLHRDWWNLNRDKYQQALADFDSALQLDPQDGSACNGRSTIHLDLKEYEQAFADCDLFIKATPENPWAYTQRGRACTLLEEYERALADFDHALQLDSHSSVTYYYRGVTYLWLKNLQQARADLIRSYELEPALGCYGWASEWAKMERGGPDGEMAQRLEAIAGTNPKSYSDHLCYGVALWLHGSSEKALIELEQLTQPIPRDGLDDYLSNWADAYFWKGMVCASLGRDQEAITAIEKVLKDLPPALLTPLHWLEPDRPDFYMNYVVPLLAQFE